MASTMAKVGFPIFVKKILIVPVVYYMGSRFLFFLNWDVLQFKDCQKWGESEKGTTYKVSTPLGVHTVTDRVGIKVFTSTTWSSTSPFAEHVLWDEYVPLFLAKMFFKKPKAKFVEIRLNVFDAGVWRLSRRRGVWGVAEAKVSPLKIRDWFCTKKSFSKPAKTEVLSLKKHPKNMCNIPWKAQKVLYSPQYSC